MKRNREDTGKVICGYLFEIDFLSSNQITRKNMLFGQFIVTRGVEMVEEYEAVENKTLAFIDLDIEGTKIVRSGVGGNGVGRGGGQGN